MRTTLMITVAVMAILLIVGYVMRTRHNSFPATPKPDPIRIAAKDLHVIYRSNAVAADRDFRYKPVIVDGTVTARAQDGWIVLDNCILCSLSEKSIRPGTKKTVYIRGLCTGIESGMVRVRNASSLWFPVTP